MLVLKLIALIQDIEFDDDGTRMYVTSSTNSKHRLIVYKLSTPFDVTSQNMLENIK